jgi:hypothetical protein
MWLKSSLVTPSFHSPSSKLPDFLLLREQFSTFSFSCKRNAVHKRADVSNSDFHRISWDKIPCWLHGKALAAESDDLGNVENEVGRVAVLTDFPIYFGTYR